MTRFDDLFADAPAVGRKVDTSAADSLFADAPTAEQAGQQRLAQADPSLPGMSAPPTGSKGIGDYFTDPAAYARQGLGDALVLATDAPRRAANVATQNAIPSLLKGNLLGQMVGGDNIDKWLAPLRMERPDAQTDWMRGQQDRLATDFDRSVSPGAAMQDDALGNADGVMEMLGVLKDNPAIAQNQLAKVFAQLVPVIAAGPAALPMAGGVFGNLNADQVEQMLLADPEKTMRLFGEEARATVPELAGASDADVLQYIASTRSDDAFGASAIINSLLPRLIPGGATLERLAISRGTGPSTTRLGNTTRGGLGEFTTEGLQGSGDRVIENVGVGEQDILKGAAQDGVLEAILGGMAGSVIGSTQAPRQTNAGKEAAHLRRIADAQARRALSPDRAQLERVEVDQNAEIAPEDDADLRGMLAVAMEQQQQAAAPEPQGLGDFLSQAMAAEPFANRPQPAPQTQTNIDPTPQPGPKPDEVADPSLLDTSRRWAPMKGANGQVLTDAQGRPKRKPVIDYDKGDTLREWLAAEGGINFEELRAYAGADPALRRDSATQYPFGMKNWPTLRTGDQGMGLETLIERMRDTGWLGENELDMAEAADMVMRAINGEKVFHPFEGAGARLARDAEQGWEAAQDNATQDLAPLGETSGRVDAMAERQALRDQDREESLTLADQAKRWAATNPAPANDPAPMFRRKDVEPAPPVDSPAWQKFTAETKVRDGDGNVIPLYHGTGEDFTVFDDAKAGDSTQHTTSPLGHFLTPNRELAEGYARNASDGRPADERVIEAWVQIKNPYTMTLEDMQAIDSPESARAVRGWLQSQGYDGIHVPEADNWIAFESGQIKDVAGKGTFDRGNPDIRFSRGNVDSVGEMRADEATGLPLNDDGTVTVYHHTSAEAAAEIRRTGRLKSSGEPDVYVTTRKENDTGYGDTAVPIRVRPDSLLLDDEFPNGRRDFRLSVGKPGGSMQVAVEAAAFSRPNTTPETPTNGIPQNLPAAQTEATRTLARRINGFLGGQQQFRAQEVAQDSLPDALAAALDALGKATGTRTVIFRNLTPDVLDFNGVTVGDGVLYVNETAAAPATTIAGHEFVHDLRKTDPDLYAELEAEVQRQGRVSAFAGKLKRQGDPNAKANALEELTADAVGDALTDRTFLERMAKESGELFKRVADAFLTFLDSLTGRVRDLGSNAYLQDVQAFRDVLADVLKRYEAGRTKSQGEAAPDADPMFSRKTPQAPSDGGDMAKAGSSVAPRASKPPPEGFVAPAGDMLGFFRESLWGFRNLYESASDKLRRTMGLEKLGEAVDVYFDRIQRNEGAFNAIMSEPVRKASKAQKDLFGEWAQHWDQKLHAEADAVLAKMDANGKALVEAWKRAAEVTGKENQRVGVKVKDAQTGELRLVGRATTYFPRRLKPGFQKALQAPTRHPKEYAELVELLLDNGVVKTAEEAEAFIRSRGRGGLEAASDYFAGIEKARTDGWPAEAYDYSMDTAIDYGNRWAERLAQIESWGQQQLDDVWDAILKSQRDPETHRYLERLRDRIYRVESQSPAAKAAATLNTVATATQLGNWATATQNLITGTGLNYLAYGMNALRGHVDVLTSWRTLSRDAVAAGVLKNDYIQLNTDYQDSVPQKLSDFASWAMKWGGYNVTERMIRLHAYATGRHVVRRAVDSIGRNPLSGEAKRYIAFLQRNGFNYERLLAENGSGPYTDRVLRYIVNLPQGSYKVNMTPILADEAAGRFFLKYRKFSTQVSRMTVENQLIPFYKAITSGEKVKVRDPVTGKMTTARARDFMGAVRFMLLTPAFGMASRVARYALFGYMIGGMPWDELEKALEDDDRAKALYGILSLIWEGMLGSGQLGLIQSPVQLSRDISERRAVADPMAPPGVAVATNMMDLFNKARAQSTLTGRDIDEFLDRSFSLYRASSRVVKLTAEMADLDAGKIEVFRRERNHARKIARRWATDEGVQANRLSVGMKFSGNTNTPTARAVTDAIALGRPEQAKAILRAHLDTLETAGQVESAIASVRGSVREAQPLKVGTYSHANRLAIIAWMKENLTESGAERVLALDRAYRKASADAGLLKEQDDNAEEKTEREGTRRSSAITAERRRELYKRLGL